MIASPKLTIRGNWLSELGFTMGSNITLTRQTGRLIIRMAKRK
ncbi:SymE family type I addiction module toxin [Proteus terrae]|nr:type I addiction module toxin, SymE family [Proteus terrae subsp. cibarius]